MGTKYLRYLHGGWEDFTKGKSYQVDEVDSDGDYVVTDDDGDVRYVGDNAIRKGEFEIVNNNTNNNLKGDVNNMIKMVICLDAKGRKYLTEGNRYKVVSLQDDGDYVVTCDDGVNRKVYANRFDDVFDDMDDTDMDDSEDFDYDDSDSDDDTDTRIIKRVKCIDASDRKYLTQGKEYDVIALQDDGDYVIIDDKGIHRKTYAKRFTDLLDVTDTSEAKSEVNGVANTTDASDALIELLRSVAPKNKSIMKVTIELVGEVDSVRQDLYNLMR